MSESRFGGAAIGVVIDGPRESPDCALVEDVLADQRLEVAALIANAKLRDVDDADVQAISQQHADRL